MKAENGAYKEVNLANVYAFCSHTFASLSTKLFEKYGASRSTWLTLSIVFFWTGTQQFFSVFTES
jgi:hypothetical protein